MSVTKSILESFELASGTEVYVQASGTGKTISLSFDSQEGSFSITLDASEAIQLVAKLQIVLKEAAHERT